MRNQEKKCFQNVIKALIRTSDFAEYGEYANCDQFVSLFANMILEHKVCPDLNGIKQALHFYQQIVGSVQKQTSHLQIENGDMKQLELQCIGDICRRQRCQIDKQSINQTIKKFTERK